MRKWKNDDDDALAFKMRDEKLMRTLNSFVEREIERVLLKD